MDTKTLAVTLIVTAMALTLLSWLVARRRRDPALLVWAAGLTCSVLGFLGLMLQAVAPSPPVIFLGNLLLLAYNISLAWGLRLFLGVPSPWPRRFTAILAVWVPAMVVLVAIVPSYAERVLFTTAFLTLFVLEFVVTLVSGKPGVPRALKVLLVGVSSLYIAMMLYRVVAVGFSGAGTMLSDTLVTVPTFLVSQITGILWGGGILLLDSHRLQERIRSDADELRRLNQLKDRVLAMAGHDLRGPVGNLRVIWEEVGQLAREDRLSEMDPRLPDLVDKSLEGTLTLLDNLVSFATAPGDRSGPAAKADLALEVAAALDLWSVAARNKGLVLQAGPVEPSLVPAGAEAVGAVLRNLVGNAVKYTPTGGSVTVRVRRSEDGGTVLEVEDTGVGLASGWDGMVLLEKCRSQPGTAGERGSGFGLYLVRELVTGWGGTLGFLPGRDRGTLVRVGFPASI